MRIIRKLLCFFGFHQNTRYERLRNKWGNPKDNTYMLICKHCSRKKIKKNGYKRKVLG